MKKTKISKRTIIILIAVLAALILASVGAVVAKYVNERKGDRFIFSKSFYFESNYLTANNKTYSLNSTQNSVEIELYNFENEWRVSEVDTSYTVTVSSTDTEFLLDGEKLTSKTYSAEKDTAVTTNIYLSNLKPGASYEIVAIASGGYTKTLKATFTVKETSDKAYMNVTENTNHVLLTVFTENVSGEVSVSFPAGLIPDNTDSILKDIEKNYIDGEYKSGSFTFNIGSYSSRSFRFFKAGNYAGSNFSVTLDGEAVTESAIS
ncbi:MAG: hypothetical protein IJY23_06800 [Clostridia bacterium]|nr:hypothetical protein [Clostridia bacterium]